MWRNHAVRDFIEWLRRFNQRKQQAYEEALKTAEEEGEQKSGDVPAPPLAGFYGLDLYSMYSSCEAVIKYLEEQSPAAATKARHHYSALTSFQDEAQEYGMAVAVGMLESQQKRVVEVMSDLLRRSEEFLRQDGYVRGDELVYAKLNALVVKDAEKYYRISLMGGHQSWNQRDTHMVPASRSWHTC
jgi:erythromycin esterase-like protein